MTVTSPEKWKRNGPARGRPTVGDTGWLRLGMHENAKALGLEIIEVDQSSLRKKLVLVVESPQRA